MTNRILRAVTVAATAFAMSIGMVATIPEAAAAAAARPTQETTGVVAGRTLTAMTGGTVTTAGTVIADRVITGDVTFTGSSLTLRNVRGTGHAIFRGSNLVVEDSEFGALSLSGTQNVRVSRVEVFGSSGNDGIHVTSDSGRVSNVVVEDTWVHNPVLNGSAHYDGMQVRGVDGLTLRRVAIELGPYKAQHNAALFLENANGGNNGSPWRTRGSSVGDTPSTPSPPTSGCGAQPSVRVGGDTSSHRPRRPRSSSSPTTATRAALSAACGP